MQIVLLFLGLTVPLDDSSPNARVRATESLRSKPDLSMVQQILPFLADSQPWRSRAPGTLPATGDCCRIWPPGPADPAGCTNQDEPGTDLRRQCVNTSLARQGKGG